MCPPQSVKPVRGVFHPRRFSAPDSINFPVKALLRRLVFRPVALVPKFVHADAYRNTPFGFLCSAIHCRPRHYFRPLFCCSFHAFNFRAFSCSIRLCCSNLSFAVIAPCSLPLMNPLDAGQYRLVYVVVFLMRFYCALDCDALAVFRVMVSAVFVVAESAQCI